MQIDLERTRLPAMEAVQVHANGGHRCNDSNGLSHYAVKMEWEILLEHYVVSCHIPQGWFLICPQAALLPLPCLLFPLIP